MSKQFNVRLQLKQDTDSNWTAAGNGQHPFVPLIGEPIYYTDLNKLKVGNGVDNINELPFLDSGGSGQAITYTLSISGNVITLTGSDSSTSPITLPVYSGGVS